MITNMAIFLLSLLNLTGMKNNGIQQYQHKWKFKISKILNFRNKSYS